MSLISGGFGDFAISGRVGMLSCIRVAAVAAVVFCLALPARAADATDAIWAVDAFHAALKRGDAEAALALLDPDVMVYEEGEVERSLREYASAHLKADMEFSAAVAQTVDGRASGRVGDLAWVTTRGRVRGTFRGRAIDSLTTETMVLMRASKGWRIVHIHWSSKAAPAD
jgi:ketosteroid isomerase-like protein